jgi:hypothetical protein
MKLIGTPYRWFYTGMPPILLGGSGPNAVCIIPWSHWWALWSSRQKSYTIPPLGMVKKKLEKAGKNAR